MEQNVLYLPYPAVGEDVDDYIFSVGDPAGPSDR